LFEITRLRENKQVERPGTAEIGDNDGINGHRSEEALPGSRVEIRNGALNVRKGFFDIKSLAGSDGRMKTWFFER
jgi:hypothetical protein